MDLEKLVRECGVELYDDEIVSENGRTIYRVSIIKVAGGGGDAWLGAKSPAANSNLAGGAEGNGAGFNGESGADLGGNLSENGADFGDQTAHTSGVTLDDCEAVSRLLSPILDVEEPVSGKWFLEVSSPGLERKLTKPRHFALSVGELVKFALAGEKAARLGRLVGASGEWAEFELLSEGGAGKKGEKGAKNAEKNAKNDNNNAQNAAQNAKNAENLATENGRLRVEISQIKKARTFVEW